MEHIEFLDLTSPQWDVLVTSFPDYDVYYLNGYVRAFKLHGDGEPFLFYYQKDDFRALSVIMMRDIAQFKPFCGEFEQGKYFDVITPYGYGGFLTDGNQSDYNIAGLHDTYVCFLKEHNVVSDFTRYHPLLKNAELLRKQFNVIDVGPTISIDTTSKERIFENLERNNRNKIRKAQKNGVIIGHGHDPELWNDFIPIYEATMDKDHASDYYYFDKEFFLSIQNDLQGHYEMFYALYEGRMIAMSIILYANGKMHYHLSGSDIEYRNLAPTNLLLYEAACWGCDIGISQFHLGGGVGAGDDSLYKFKEGFNRKSSNMFSIGKTVVNQEMYDKLMDLRAQKDADFDKTTNYFPAYRG